MKPMIALKNRKGESIQLGRLLGKGGEGTVYEVLGASSLVAKIYHQPLDPEKASKLHAMSDMKTDRLLALTAWPMDVLNGLDGKPKGFLMPQVTGHKDIHALYTPKSRKDSFPEADWRFLVHAAANVARAFAMIHDHGCVIGDVNHGSVLGRYFGCFLGFFDLDVSPVLIRY
jgi:DNA-binding helix-hairpin-helix protein with protein kinase domain